MARDSRLMVTLEDRFRPDFAERLDRRTALAKGLLARVEQIESDLGGSDGLSHARRSLVRRVVWLEAVVEHAEQRLAAGEAIDLGGHVSAVNSLVGLYRLLGTERRPRTVRRLADVMAGRVSAAPAPEAAP